MLKRIRLKDFKSFVDEEVKLARLTLLVGANASGKSNFFDALRFLRGLATGLTLSEVVNGEKRIGPDAWQGIRGRVDEVARFGLNQFAIDSLWVTPTLNPTETEHRITCKISAGVRLKQETLLSQNEELLHLEEVEGSEQVIARAGQETVHFKGDHSLLGNFKRLVPLFSDSSVLDSWIGFGFKLTQVDFIVMRPPAMRDFGRRGDPLGGDGHNLSGVLGDLCQDPDDKQALVHWLAELCAPEIEDLDFIEVKELGDVMAMFVEKGGKRISARSISDGTLHFLGTLLALRTAEPGSVILIEEIETGLHPTRIRLLVEYLETVTRERDIQVIATTHSPVVLQWLSDESLRNTVVFGRVPEHEGTIMRRLGDLPYFEEVIQKKGIEELFSTGWLEMAL